MLIGSSGDFGHQEEEECEGRAKYRMMEIEEEKNGPSVLLLCCCSFSSFPLLPSSTCSFCADNLEIIDKETLVSERFCAKRNC